MRSPEDRLSGPKPTSTPALWHGEPGAHALDALRSAAGGLDSDEALQRLARHGPNTLPEAPGRSPLRRLLAQFNNALILFLLSAAVAAWFLDHVVDAAVILCVVIVNALVGFIQEGKAEQALQAIRQMIAPRTNVLRDGHRTGVAVAELVPGDIVLLDAGDRVPADLRLLRAHGLLIDEALLTGESVAAEKNHKPVAPDAALGDRHCMAYSGTLVASGAGAGVVVATGAQTEIGRISTMLQGVEQLTTPLLRQINRFGRQFTWIAISGAAALFAFAVTVRAVPWTEALIATVALAVGVVPESLPAVISITLAIGVQRMAARHAVIRRLPAVETLGATSVICTDKTGTLTRNEMTARRLVTAGHEIIASGAGYTPEGVLTSPGADDDEDALAASMPLIRCGLLCNDAHLRGKDGHWLVEGDPMEGALVALAMKAGVDPAHARSEWPRLDLIPFDAAHRFMATLHHNAADERWVYVKGAPERVLAMSASQGADGAMQALDPAYWQRRIADAASQGERVLAFAAKRLTAQHHDLSFADVESGLHFLGIIGFIDPPREEATSAIAECRSAGIAVKMITGDHAATATAIGRQLHLADDPVAMTGADLDAIPEDKLPEVVRRTSVFARTSPEHKLRIVRALQSQGLVVAMTGDGVNDAPSLKQADVGVAMGIKGTEAAKEAAEMVLMDDNFASIVNAVHEGRTVYDNIRKVAAWTIPTNGGEVLTVIVAILFGFALPMTATHILWINLTLTVTLGLVLAFEPPEPGVMRRPPRAPDAPLLSPFLLWRVILVSVLFTVCALALFFYSLHRGDPVETARTLVVNLISVLEIFYLFSVRYLHMTSMTWRGALGTPAVLLAIAAVVVLQLLFTYAPFMQAIFDSRPVSIADGVLIILIGAALMILLEGEKSLMRRLGIFEELNDGRQALRAAPAAS